MDDAASRPVDLTDIPVRIPVEAYTSEAYARAENDKLWPKVWQAACRTEGDRESRRLRRPTISWTSPSSWFARPPTGSRPSTMSASTAAGVSRRAAGAPSSSCVASTAGGGISTAKTLSYLIPRTGETRLDADNLRLGSINVDTWGGWVWINMDPNCEPLREYLGAAVPMLDPYQLDQMRYRWRQWLYFPCNWKTALEAFNESYHVLATHPELGRGLARQLEWRRRAPFVARQAQVRAAASAARRRG